LPVPPLGKGNCNRSLSNPAGGRLRSKMCNQLVQPPLVHAGPFNQSKVNRAEYK
jgi:hypothetical protein